MIDQPSNTKTGKEHDVVRYSLGLRLQLLFFAFMGLFWTYGTILFGLNTFRGYTAHQVDCIGLPFIARLVFLAAMISSMMLIYWGIRNLWFFVYEFRLDGNLLEIYDPVLRKRRTMALDQVLTISTFYILGTPLVSGVTGYLLKTDDRSSVTLSGALPIYQEILQKCTNAVYNKISMLNFR